MTYESHPIVSVDLNALKLDLRNPRLPQLVSSEEEALAQMYAEGEVLDLATEILRDKYFDHEPLIVVQGNDGAFTVVEGNRRVSALKGLHSPSSVPDFEEALERALKKYSSEANDLPLKVRALHVPTRREAMQHVARLHTESPKKRWSTDQQARFFFNQLREGMKAEDIIAEFPGRNVTKGLKRASLRLLLLAIEYQDPQLKEFAGLIKMSYLDRAFGFKEIAEPCGVEFNANGELLPAGLSPAEVASNLSPGNVAAIEYLMKSFRDDELNTRSPEFLRNESGGRVEEFAEKLRNAADLGRSGSDDFKLRDDRREDDEDFNGDFGGGSGANSESSANSDAGDVESDAEAEEETSGKRGPNSTDAGPCLNVEDMAYKQLPKGLRDRYYEIRKIKVAEAPVALSMHLRGVLEATIKWALGETASDDEGELREVVKTLKNRPGLPKKTGQVLRQILPELDAKGTKHEAPGNVYWFNAVCHNYEFAVSERDVRDAWNKISPLLRWLIDQHVRR